MFACLLERICFEITRIVLLKNRDSSLDKVSFIIPTFNGEKYLPNCLESVFNGSYKNFEVIVVDDGSTDNTREVLTLYEDRVKYIFQERKGMAAARNFGMENVTGELIAFLDVDDVNGKMRIELEVKKLLENPRSGMVFCGCTFINEGGSFLKGVGRYPDFEKSKFLGILFEENKIFSISTTLIRKDVIEKVGYFDQSLPFLEDYDLWLRIASKYPIEYIDLPITRIRKHSNNYEKMFENTDEIQKKIFLKHDPRDLAVALAKLYKKEDDFRVSFGKLLMKTGYDMEAMKNFLKAIRVNPESSEAHFQIGNYYFYRKEIDKSIISYRRCLNIEPDHIGCRNNLGILLSYKGDIMNSMKEFQKVMTIQADFANAEFNLNCVREKTGLHRLKVHF